MKLIVCLEKWDRPPSFLLVDYYQVGDGSVFRVAAKANGVKYDRDCCSTPTTGSEACRCVPKSGLALVLMVVGFVVLYNK